MSERKYFNTIQRFKDTCIINEHGCHMTSIKPNPVNNYVSVSYRNKHVFLHRLMYEQKHGAIADGMSLGHTCDVNYPVGSAAYRLCCNPDHLTPVTRQQNTAHMFETGRGANIPLFKPGQSAGANNVNAKLTMDIARELRARVVNGQKKYGSLKAWANEFGVSENIISDVLSGKSWKEPPA